MAIAGRRYANLRILIMEESGNVMGVEFLRIQV
jgi:hypothetical protein